MTLSFDRINKARAAGYDDDKIIESIGRKDPNFGARIKKAREAGHDSKAIMQSIEKRLNAPDKEVNTPKSNAVNTSTQQHGKTPNYGTSQRDPYDSELKYFEKNPHVGGMATEDDRVILNPYSKLNDQQKGAVYQNEATRLHLRKSKNKPNFEITDDQKKFFKDYSQDPQDIRDTIIARIVSGDDSAGNPTEEQIKYAESIKKEMSQPEKDSKSSYADYFKKGLLGSASGELATIGQKKPEEISQDPGFWEALVQETGNLAGNAPYILAGGTLGAATGAAIGSLGGPAGTGIGGVLGGGFGAFAFPEFIQQSLKEYKDYVAKGNDLTYGEFLQRADRVASKTLNSGLMGTILGSVNKAMPLLQKTPGIGKLFESKIAQKTAAITAETATLATVPAITKGELPTSRDYAHALALVAGLNALGMPKAIKDKIQSKGESSGLTPEEFAKTPEAKKILEEVKAEETKTKKPAENTVDAFSQLGRGLTDNFYRDTFKAIQEGKTSISGGKDEFMEAAKNNYDKGLIKSKEDLKRFRKVWDEKFNKKPKKGQPVSIKKPKDQANKKTEAPEVSKKEVEPTRNLASNFKIKEIRTPNSAKIIVQPIAVPLKKNNPIKKTDHLFPESKDDIGPYGYRIKDYRNEPSRMSPEYTKQEKDIIESYKKKIKDIKGKSKKELKEKEDLTKEMENVRKDILYERLENERKQKKIPIPENKKSSYISDVTGIIKHTPAGTVGDYIESPDLRRFLKDVLDYPVRFSIDQILKGKPLGYYRRGEPISLSEKLKEKGDYHHILKKVILEEAGHLLQDAKGRLSDLHKTFELDYTERPQEVTVKKFTKWALKVEKEFLQKEKELKELTKNIKPHPLVISKKQYSREKAKNLLKKTLNKKPVEPIEETTGQGATERLEYAKTGIQRIKEKVGDVVETIKHPEEMAKKIYTGVFDFVEPIKRLEKDVPVEEQVTTKIKQAQNSASDINQVLTKGVFDNNSNRMISGSLKDVYQDAGEVWRKAVKGLKDAEYSLQEMDVYRTSKEALKRQKRGLKSGIDTKIAIRDVARLKQKYGPIDQRLQKFQKDTLNHYGKDTLGDERIEQWTQDSHASLYRMMDYGNDAILKQGSLEPKKWWHKAFGSLRKILPPSETDLQNTAMLIMNSKKNDSVLQYKKGVEAGTLPGKIVKSKNKEMPSKMMEDLEIDPENAALAENLYNQSRKDAYTPEKGRLKGWEDGKPFEIEVPEDVYNAYSSLVPADTGLFTKVLRTASHLFSKGITTEPVANVYITARDAMNSLIYSKTGSNPISIFKALADINRDSHSWNQYKSLGGDQYASRLMTRADRATKLDELLKIESPNVVIMPFKKLGEFLKKNMDNLSAAVPFAEYQRAIKKFGDTPEGRLQALMEAKSVTYDPTMKGSSKTVRTLGAVNPFLNVMIQEPLMIAKNIKRPLFIAKGVTAIALPSLALKFLNDGNEDYESLSPISKAMYWHFYVGDKHVAMPIPWLTAALFKLPAELFYDISKGDGGDSWRGLYSYVASQLSGTWNPIVTAAVEQSTNRSLPSPAGLLLMPIADVEKRAPPVVPRRLENLPPEQQYTSSTSQLARWYGSMWAASPIKVDRLIKTFGGNVAGKTLALIDEMAYATGLVEDDRPDKGISNYLLLGKFIQDSTPTQTKYTEEFYTRLEQARLEKGRDKPNDFKKLNSYNSRISQKFKQYRDIEQKKMDPKRKRDLLREKQKEINALYKQAVKE